MQAEELAAEFGIRDVLDFAAVPGGLVKAVIALDGMKGELFLQGAQVTHWQPEGHRPVIFTSPNAVFAPGTAIRGGIPIIFPWFGPHRSEPKAPQHGFARAAPWRLDHTERNADGISLTLTLEPADPPSPFWPEAFRASVTVGFGPVLSLALTVDNRGGREIVLEEALHSYFAISDIAKVSVSGLAGRTYIDKTDGMRRKTQAPEPIALTKETDSVYLDTRASCAIDDPEWRRRILIEKAGAASTIVWNPWAEKAAAMADLGPDAWRGMLCVETGNAGDNEVRLAPGGEHRMITRISVEAVE